MLIMSTAIRPPTMTMAKGRCESEPIPWEVAAGTNPSDATSMVIRIGRKRWIAPLVAALSIECPRDRSWLMYSTMMTPVWTETPKRARNPIPEETLKLVALRNSATTPPIGAIATVARIRLAHFIDPNMEYRIMKMTGSVSGVTEASRFWGGCWLAYG